MRVVKKDSFFNKFFKAISGCILPMIAPMAAGGIITPLIFLTSSSLTMLSSASTKRRRVMQFVTLTMFSLPPTAAISSSAN